MNAQKLDERRTPWESFRLVEVGDLAEVLENGGGKLSIAALDSGDPNRKPKGQG